jgi:hypothetical protein
LWPSWPSGGGSEAGENFLPWLFDRYQREGGKEGNFYQDWLKPLFFQAFRAPPGRKPNAFAHLPSDVREVYEGAPYLNGELFREKEGIDLPEAFLTDEAVKRFYEFLFAYNFTVEENTAYEVDLELNPELLGLILERLVNTVGVEGRTSELGAHYTPRTEVDLICRLALAERLYREGLPLEKAYALLNGEVEELSQEERKTAKRLLLDVKVLDPSVGSGAFLVGDAPGPGGSPRPPRGAQDLGKEEAPLAEPPRGGRALLGGVDGGTQALARLLSGTP